MSDSKGENMNLTAYTFYWYKTCKEQNHQKTTQAIYLFYIKNYIGNSHIGKKDITQITHSDLQNYLTELRKNGKTGKQLSAWTVIKVRQILISVFNLAIKEKVIQYNIAADTESIKTTYKRKTIFSHKAQSEFLKRTKNHRFYVAYVLLFFLGCRRSEILGLSWDSIDLIKKELIICQTLVIEDNQISLKKTTKTQNSLRTIPLPKEICNLLKSWKKKQRKEEKECPDYQNTHNLVFVNKDGSMHDPRYFSRNFKEMVKRIPICDNSLHVHSTRHTWATNMIQMGVALSDIQAMGGWAKPDTLLNIYAQTVKKSQIKAINSLYNSFDI